MKKFFGFLALVAYLVLGVPAGAQAPAAEAGKVLTWGENDSGQLGMGNTSPSDWRRHTPFNPALIPSLAKIMALAAGQATAAAVDSNGAVWVWGPTVHTPTRDGVQLLGTPAKLPGLTGVIAVSLGDSDLIEHGLALKADGTVWAWGSNGYGELGREPISSGKPDFSAVPVQVSGLSDVSAIAAGPIFSLALKSDGTVWGWGSNHNGQLGNGTFARQPYAAQARPVQVSNLKKITAIAVGTAYCLALDSDGAVWAWGLNGLGVLARPVPPNPDPLPATPEARQAFVDTFKFPTPEKIAGLPKTKAIAAKGVTCLALATDGRVYAWGQQVPRRLTAEEMQEKNVKPEDNGLSLDRDTSFPVLIEGLGDVVSVAVGGLNSIALKSDGTVWSWGSGNYRVGMKDAQEVANLPLSEFGRRMVTPMQVKGVTATVISAGAAFCMACGGMPRASFLDWYVGFSRLVKDRTARINDARAVAAGIALPLSTARRELGRLNRVLLEADRAGRSGEPTASREIIDRLKLKFTAESDQCRECLKHLDEATAEAKTAMGDILAALKTGFDSFSDQDAQPQLALWKEHFDSAAAELPMEMALAAREDDTIVDEAQKGGLDKLPIGMRVKLGNYLLQRGEVADAVYTFRSALRSDPRDVGVQDGLARAEAGVMRLSMSKSAGALAEAREAFYKLIDASGYSDRPVRPTDWDWLVLPTDWDWLATESWEALIHLPVNLADIIFGRTRAEQTRLRSEELELVRNLLVIPVIMRLRLKGNTLDEISRMPGRKIREVLPLKTAGGRPYSDEEMNKLGAQIHKAMAIGDFPLLMKKDAGLEELRGGLIKPYITPDDLPDTWHNDLGAGLAETAIILALPMARLSKGGVTVTEYLGYITRYEKAVGWFGGTETGQRLLRGLQQYHELQAALIRAGTWTEYARFVNFKGGELLAMLMLQGYTIDLANRYGGETAAVITSCLVMMIGDLNLLTRWLAAGKISKEAAILVLDAAIRQGEEALERIEQNAAIIKRLRELKAKITSGTTFSPEDTAYLAKYKSLDPDFVPNGDGVHDSELPRRQLAQDANTGADRGASKACRELENDVAKEKGRLNSQAGRAKEARDRLAAAPEPADPVPPASARARLAGKDAPKDWGENGGYRIPDGPAPGSKWAQAEEAMRNGDYDGARELYRQAHAGGEITDELFTAFEQRAGEALEVRRLPLGEKQNTSAEFPPNQVDKILVKNWGPKDGKIPIVRTDPEAIGQVYSYSDETGSYIVKEVALKNPANVDIVESAIVASRLMDELGIPNSRVAFRIIGEGDERTVRFLIRRIDGEDMNNLTSGELFQYRKDLSEQRAFSLLIRDYDRKPSNFFRGRDGRVYYIDPDMGHMYEPNAIVPGKLEGRGGQDHWYWRSNETIKSLTGDGDPEMVKRLTNGIKTNMVERSLTANDAQAMVKHINTLMDPANQAKLEDLLTRAYREARGPEAHVLAIKELVTRTIKTMRDRARRIPDVLKLLNERNGIPLPTGSGGFPPPSPRSISSPSPYPWPDSRPGEGSAYPAPVF